MHDFTILILKGAYPSSVSITRDMLAAAAALAKTSGAVPPRWQFCSVEGGMVTLQGGMAIETSKLPAPSAEDGSLWVLPGLGLNTQADIDARLAAPDAVLAAQALSLHHRLGGRVAASCSAVFLLGAAALLEHRRATTTWWLAPLLQRMNPACAVDANRMVCADGPVITAGAAMAQTDLMLYVLREQCGSRLTDTVARMMLISKRHAQAAFILPEALSSGNDLVARLAARVDASLPNPPSITALAQEFCVSERTLARHIKKTTGNSTLALVQSVRLRRARQLLEESRMTIDQVAEAVGYQDATALRRLMKKTMGANPSGYRTDSKPHAKHLPAHAK